MDITTNQLAMAFVLSGVILVASGLLSHLIVELVQDYFARTVLAIATGLVLTGALV